MDIRQFLYTPGGLGGDQPRTPLANINTNITIGTGGDTAGTGSGNITMKHGAKRRASEQLDEIDDESEGAAAAIRGKRAKGLDQRTKSAAGLDQGTLPPI